MTGPDYQRPDVAVPEQWSPPEESDFYRPETVTAWWTTLNDPVLDALIARSTEANLDLQIAEARVREARAARGIAEAALWPTLRASGSYARVQTVEPDIPGAGSPLTLGGSLGPNGLTPSISVRGDNISVTRSGVGENALTSVSVTPGGQSGFDREQDLFQAGFDAAWELDVFGGNRRGVEAAEAITEATIEARRNLLVSLLSEVALNYIELRSAQNRRQIALNNIEAQERTVRITRERFRVGLSSELDAIRAEALLASTRSQLPLLDTQIETSIHRLSVLLGEQPAALRDELRPAAALPTPPDTVPVGLPSDLLRRRPDIRQAERELAAATARIGQAMAERFPSFTLTGNLAGQAGTLGDIFDSANRMWSLGPGVRIPIFEGGRIRANIEVQNARQEQALIDYEQTILLALEDVENSLVSFANEQARRQSLEETVESNRRAVRLANERYVQGLEDFLSVTQAQQELYRSEDELVRSASFVLTDLVSLYKALGGGWEIEETALAMPAAPDEESDLMEPADS